MRGLLSGWSQPQTISRISRILQTSAYTYIFQGRILRTSANITNCQSWVMMSPMTRVTLTRAQTTRRREIRIKPRTRPPPSALLLPLLGSSVVPSRVTPVKVKGEVSQERLMLECVSDVLDIMHGRVADAGLLMCDRTAQARPRRIPYTRTVRVYVHMSMLGLYP